MKFSSSFVLILSVVFFTNCKSGTKNEISQAELRDTIQKIADTITANNTTDTTSVNEDENTDPSMTSYLNFAHEEFDGVPSTFEAKYIGFDIGDYPHITFKDEKGKEYDFGDGANSYGSFKEEDFLAKKSKYEGKMFKLTWEWKTSTFLCCDGEMDKKIAKVPSIVNLELVR